MERLITNFARFGFGWRNVNSVCLCHILSRRFANNSCSVQTLHKDAFMLCLMIPQGFIFVAMDKDYLNIRDPSCLSMSHVANVVLVVKWSRCGFAAFKSGAQNAGGTWWMTVRHRNSNIMIQGSHKHKAAHPQQNKGSDNKYKRNANPMPFTSFFGRNQTCTNPTMIQMAMPVDSILRSKQTRPNVSVA